MLHYCLSLVVRLQGGSTQNEGYIEIKDSAGMWGGICDDAWDLLDGHVICRMLGYPSAETVYTHSSPFGSGGGHFTLDNVGCVGNEASIFDCPRPYNVGKHNCASSEWSGVKCHEMDRVRLKSVTWNSNLEQANEGYVEVLGKEIEIIHRLFLFITMYF